MAIRCPKPRNNVIDPLPLMDELGTDALRFTLLVGSTPGNDISLDVKRVEANRNFANKIWNAGRFVIGAINNAPKTAVKEPEWTLADSWIWARYKSLLAETNRLFESYQFGEAGRQIYDFFWSEFADWYIETAKTQLAKGGDRALLHRPDPHPPVGWLSEIVASLHTLCDRRIMGTSERICRSSIRKDSLPKVAGQRL